MVARSRVAVVFRNCNITFTLSFPAIVAGVANSVVKEAWLKVMAETSTAAEPPFLMVTLSNCGDPDRTSVNASDVNTAPVLGFVMLRGLVPVPLRGTFIAAWLKLLCVMVTVSGTDPSAFGVNVTLILTLSFGRMSADGFPSTR